MSYVIDVVQSCIPSSYADAVDLREEVAEVKTGPISDDGEVEFEPPSVEMAELHRRLTARYPCIVDDSEGPWSDGPLINNFGQKLATLGICFSRVEEVLPFVIQEATAMGFWVLDQQDEAAHVPGGAVLRAQAQDDMVPGKRWWQFWR